MAENVHQEHGKRKKRKSKLWVWILGGLAMLILILFLAVPLFLSSAAGRSLVVSKINQSVDGQVQMDDLSVGWFRGVRIRNVSFDDDQGNTSVQVKRIETQPQLAALLGGRVKLGKTVVENPRVYLKVSPPEAGEPKPETARERADRGAEGMPQLPVHQIDLEIIDGQATIEIAGQPQQKVMFTNIASNVALSPGKASTMAFSMQVQDGQTPGTVQAQGTVDADQKDWTIKDGRFNVKIANLQLASLKPLFALAGQPMDMAGELNADASVQVSNNELQDVQANATVTDFAQGTGQQRTTFEQPVRLTAQASQQGQTIRIDKLNVESGFLTVDTSGDMNNLKYSVQANLAETQKFAGQFVDMGGLGMQGSLNVSGTVSLTDDTISVTSQGAAQKLQLTKEGVQTPVTDVKLDLEGTYLRSTEMLRIARADVTSTPVTVQVSSLAYPLAKSDKPQPVSLNASTQMDLAQVWPFVQVFAETPKGMAVAGKMNAGVQISSQGSQVRLLTEDTAITNLRISQPGQEAFTQERVTLGADVLLDTEDKTIDIKTLNLRGTQGQQLIEVTKGSLDRTVSQNTTTLKGQFEAAYDLKALTSFAGPFLPEKLTMEGQRKGFFNFQSQYPTAQPELMAANLNGQGAVGFTSANFMGLKFGETQLNLNIKQGLMQFELPDAKVNQGTLRLAAQVNLAEEKKTLQLTRPMKVLENVQLDDELTGNLLVYMNPMFAKQTNVTGVASLECSKLVIPLSAPMDVAEVLLNATVAMSDMNLKAAGIIGAILSRTDNRSAWKAQLLPTELVMADGVLQYKNMEFILDRYPIGFSGRVFLDRPVPALDMTVALPYSGRLESVHAGEDMSKRVTVQMQGPIADPKLDLSKLFESMLQRGIEGEIQRGLERIFK
jgi:hypothetical protein